jgi:Pyruvate/2-oxoacid:ferredoxin oxidoreductase delta subunit
MNNDLISRSALIKTLNEAQVEFDEFYKGLGRAKTIVNNAPTVEERQTGKWILEEIYYDNYHMIDNNIFYCSICGRRVTTTASKATVAVVYPFCQGCGTKMEEKSE